jgi:hypothetical protein
MINRNISSVPVLLRESNRWYGSIDLMDVCRYVISHFGETKFTKEKSFWELVEQEGKFAHKTVADLMSKNGQEENRRKVQQASTNCIEFVICLFSSSIQW